MLFLSLAIAQASAPSTASALPAAPPAAPPDKLALPAGFQESTVMTGLDHPMALEFAADGRIFVAEKRGVIKVFDGLGDSTPTTFADLRTNVYNFWDRGLNSMALHPNFPATPYVYVLYTHDAAAGGTAPLWGTPGANTDPCPSPPGPTTDGCIASGRLSRLQAAGDVMTGSELVLVEGWCQQYPSHTMDTLRFGPDGALYASGGDAAKFDNHDWGQWGGSPGSPTPRNPCNDPPGGVGGQMTLPTAEGGSLRSQDLRTSSDPTGLNGTLIRIDPMTGLAASGNPVAGPDENARRTIAYGFRNPFRFTFRPGTSEVWLGDVGDVRWEEINRIVDPAGSVKNFGWPCYEGAARHPGWDSLNATICENLYADGVSAVVAPHYAYNHDQSVVAGDGCPVGGAASAGLAFYEGGPYPDEYDEALFFADYTRKCIWVMRAGANGLPDPATRSIFISAAANPVDLQVGPNGDLFYLDYLGGAIRRVTYFTANQPPTADVAAMPTNGPLPLTVNFDGTGSSDPEGSTLSYAWDLDGDEAFDDSTVAAPTHTYLTAANVTVRLRVTDVQGSTGVDAVVISAGNSAPTASIDTPAAGVRWSVGQTVAFSGHASDDEQGALPAASLVWELVLHHCATPTNCHAHPLEEFSGVAAGSFVAPDHDYPAYLELTLTATDAGGLQSTVTRRLDPETVILSLNSEPSGLALSVGTETSATPFQREVIHGSSIALSAPTPQAQGSEMYSFSSWSDGGARSHTYIANDAGSLTATFEVSSTVTYADDTFSRSVSNGWGSAPVGGSYSLLFNAADYDVNGSAGTIVHRTGTTRAVTLGSVVEREIDLVFQVQTDKPATGDGIYVWVIGRRTPNGQSEYRSRMLLTPSGGVRLRTIRVLNGAQAALGSEVQVGGISHAPGTPIAMRVQFEGASPTTIRTRVWAAGTPEPETWQSVVTDAGAALQTTGSIGLRSYLAGNATNSPIILAFDDLRATSIGPVAPPPPPPPPPPDDEVLAVDAFDDRTLTNSWGSAATGGAYTLLDNVADYDVGSGVGTVFHRAGNTKATTLSEVSARDIDVTFSFAADKAATGDGIYVWSVGRRTVDGTGEYRARIRLAPGGGVWLRTIRWLNGSQVALGTDVLVPGLTYAAGTRLMARAQFVGTTPTTVRIKVWAAGTSEPASWASVATDSSAALQVAGSVGLRSYVALNTTNAPVVISFDDLRVMTVP